MQALLLSPHTAPLLASLEAATPADPISFLVNYGVAGIIIVLLVTGRLTTKGEVDRLERQLNEAREDLKAMAIANQALIQQVTGHTLPQMADLATMLDKIPKQSGEPALTATLARLEAMLSGLEGTPPAATKGT